MGCRKKIEFQIKINIPNEPGLVLNFVTPFVLARMICIFISTNRRAWEKCFEQIFIKITNPYIRTEACTRNAYHVEKKKKDFMRKKICI